MSAVVGQEKFDPTPYDEDLAPILGERRNWSWINYRSPSSPEAAMETAEEHR